MNNRICSLKSAIIFLIVIVLFCLVAIVGAPTLAESYDSEEGAVQPRTDRRLFVLNTTQKFMPPVVTSRLPLIKPLRIKVTFDNNQSVGDYYYRKARTATIEVTQTGFNPEELYVGVRYSPYYFQDFGPIERKNITFTPVSGKEATYRGTLAFKKDGHYGFTIEGTDPFTKNPVSYSEYFYIDTVAPVIDLTFDKEMDEGGFYTDAVTGTLRVKEANFEKRDIKISVKHKPAGQTAFTDIAVDRNFNSETIDTFTKKIPLAEEGAYTIDVSYKDPSGHVATPIKKEFLIDRAAPILSVQFDDDEVPESNYYNKIRTATITVEESNFDPNLVVIEQNAVRAGEAVEPPALSDWVSDGNKHTATILYDVDGEYSLKVSCSDMAGRQAEAYAGENFILDTSPPLLTVEGIPAGAAGQSSIAPVIEYSDPNLVPESVDIQLEGLRCGVIRNIKELKAEPTGGRVAYVEFPRTKESDDLYAITINMTDKANNTISEKILFSVNRFGSTFAVGDETKALAGTYVKTTPDVFVTETNVNHLTMNRVTLFKDNLSITLTEGVDYSLERSGDDNSFYQYAYRVFSGNFSGDGLYRLSFSSKDSAGNVSESSSFLGEKDISFVVDNTAPIASFLNLEEGRAYDGSEYDVVFSADDNVKLASVLLYLDGEKAREWDAGAIDMLVSRGEDFHFTVAGGSSASRHLRVICSDAAGNVIEKEIASFYVTTNRWVYVMNNPQIRTMVFVGGGVVLLLTAFTVFLILSRRAKKRRKLSRTEESPHTEVPENVPVIAGSTVENPYVYQGHDKDFSREALEEAIRKDQPVTNQLEGQSFEQPNGAQKGGGAERSVTHADGPDPSKLDFGDTSLLSKGQPNETTVLSEGKMNETTVLSKGQPNETTVLSNGNMNETTVLNDTR